MLLKIIGLRIDLTSYKDSVAKIINWSRQNESRSVYAANVHMIMEAYDHVDFREIVNSADLVTPDGMPLVWALRMKGIINQERVYGPTLMLEVLREAQEQQILVGFLGSTEDVLKKLSEQMLVSFPKLKIVLSMPLPFHSLPLSEDEIICTQINEAGVRILFVALGCPKQERWIAQHKGKINAVMLGVGAAFAFHAGTVHQAPARVQKIGLEWLFRFIQEPRRLWKRYLVNNPRFMVLISIELIKNYFARHRR